MGMPLFLNELTVHADWNDFLTGSITGELAEIERQVTGSEFTPEAGKVLRFLEFQLSSVRIIILGQDPYPQPGVATGRAFEVGNLQSWNVPFQNVSLKNILRAVYKAYTGEIISFGLLKQKFDNEFPVLPPSKLFAHWDSQGVLLLNTSFTCETWKPGSHQKLWKGFTGRLLEYLAQKAPHASWFLWGNHALEATKNVRIVNKFVSLHPMMCYRMPSRSGDFLYGTNNCFEPFAEVIDWTGYGMKRTTGMTGRLF